MILQTGGWAVGATSTRSYPNSSAFFSASRVASIPSCSLSGPITRTGEIRISLLTLNFCSAIAHLSFQPGSLRQRHNGPPYHIILQMFEKCLEAHGAGVRPSAAAHREGAVLNFAITGNQH